MENQDATTGTTQQNDESEGGTLRVKALSLQFAKWFYEMLNENKCIDAEHFWPDSKLTLYLITGCDTLTQTVTDDPDEFTRLLFTTKSKYNLYFLPNLLPVGTQGRMDPHGAVLVSCCGTLHANEKCPGVFEQAFRLTRDQRANNTWKIETTELHLKIREAIVGPRQVAVPPTQSTQDSTDEDNNMQAQPAPQQQAVALVLPRVEPPTMTPFSTRTRPVAPLTRQQQQTHLLLPHGLEEGGDDCIVPSTPTLFVPRRADGFGEAVSSPHVPTSGGFTFNENAPPNNTSSNEVIPEQTLEIGQLDDNSTGRSVPSTPLQASPQEAGPSGEDQSSQQTPNSEVDIPTITVSGAGDEATATPEASAGESML